MAVFTFRLQTLLDQKLDGEAKARTAVVEKQRLLDEEQNILLQLVEFEQSIRLSIDSTRDRLLRISGVNIVADVQCRNDYLAGLRQDLSAARERTLGQQFVLEEAQMNLVHAETHARECAREAEKLNRYRAKLEERSVADQAKKEQLEQDELGNTMYLSRRAGR